MNNDLSGDLSSLPADYDDVENQAQPKHSTSSSQRRSKSKQLDVQDSDEEMEETFVDPPATQTQTRKPTASQSQVPAKKGSGMKRSDGNQGRKKN